MRNTQHRLCRFLGGTHSKFIDWLNCCGILIVGIALRCLRHILASFIDRVSDRLVHMVRRSLAFLVLGCAGRGRGRRRRCWLDWRRCEGLERRRIQLRRSAHFALPSALPWASTQYSIPVCLSVIVPLAVAGCGIGACACGACVCCCGPCGTFWL